MHRATPSDSCPSRACAVGVAVVRHGARVGDIGAAIAELARANGVLMVRELCGHGIGRTIHAAPEVPHVAIRGTGAKLVLGMALTVEPMIGAEHEAAPVVALRVASAPREIVCAPAVQVERSASLLVRVADLDRRVERARGTLGIATCDKGLPAMLMALAGTLDLPVRCDLMSISPKRANSTPDAAQPSVNKEAAASIRGVGAVPARASHHSNRRRARSTRHTRSDTARRSPEPM